MTNAYLKIVKRIGQKEGRFATFAIQIIISVSCVALNVRQSQMSRHCKAQAARLSSKMSGRVAVFSKPKGACQLRRNNSSNKHCYVHAYCLDKFGICQIRWHLMSSADKMFHHSCIALWLLSLLCISYAVCASPDCRLSTSQYCRRVAK